jgi:hypothetical protein
MIRFYKNTELPDFEKQGYYKEMNFAIHEMACNEPDSFEIFAGSVASVNGFKHLLLDSLGNKISEVVLDPAMISLLFGYYICYWNGLGSSLANGIGQFEVTNGPTTWLSEPFRITNNTTISATMGDYNNDFDFSFNSE